MKIIITGASGLLGRAIKSQLQRDSCWDIISLGFSRLKDGMIKVDLKDEKAIERLLNTYKPDVIIHSAAERRPDHVINNETETIKLNVGSTEIIAKEASKRGIFLIYISTDYVFDGTKPPYKETDEPNPLNKYGETKYQGEEVVKKYCKVHGILRVPILYGNVEFIKESAVTGLFPILKNSTTEVAVSNYERRYPTHVDDVSNVIHQILRYRLDHPDFSGVWHWSGNEEMTKYTMIKIMSTVFNLPMDHVKPDNEPTKGALRPYNAQLNCAVLENIGIQSRTSFETGIKECLVDFIQC